MRTADQAAAAWVAGLSNAGQKITDGVNSVTVAPGQLAARQKGAYTQGVAANADKWAKNVGAVPLATWQQDVIQKGVPRIATGAAQAQQKFGVFLAKLLPFIAAGKGSLPPRGSFDQNIARMTAWARYMHGFQK